MALLAPLAEMEAVAPPLFAKVSGSLTGVVVKERWYLERARSCRSNHTYRECYCRTQDGVAISARAAIKLLNDVVGTGGALKRPILSRSIT